jgi:hypothetical protein
MWIVSRSGSLNLESMKSRFLRLARSVVLTLAFAGSVYAVPFTLDAASSPIVNGNITSGFYEVAANGTDSGTAAGLYTAIISGTGALLDPAKVEIFFGSNPQPVLTSAFVKAGEQYLFWNAADLAAFNAGTFTSIILIQNGLPNNPANAYHEISHAGFFGTPGGSSVPDGGSALVLLGIGLLGIIGAKRKFARV